MIDARKALLDALEALEDHLNAVVLVGAQAIYMHTAHIISSVADMTKDADLALNRTLLSSSPKLEVVLKDSGFLPGDNPGSWISKAGMPVDLMVPEAHVERKGRSAEIVPHSSISARNTAGIEACLIDNSLMKIEAIDPRDSRSFEILVAGPAALLIAKSHKIGERINNRRKIDNKDAYDVYKILQAIDSETIANRINILRKDSFCGSSVLKGFEYFKTTFGAGVNSVGIQMAGQAEAEPGNVNTVMSSLNILVTDLIAILES